MNKVTFLGFRGSYRPNRFPLRSAPASYSPLLWLVIVIACVIMLNLQIYLTNHCAYCWPF